MTPCSAHAIALFPSLPSLPSSALHMSTSRKRKKKKKKIRKALIQQNGLCLGCTSQPGSIPRSCAFYRSTTFFFFSGKQIHARNHSKPSVLFRSHTHAHQILRKCFQSSGKCHQQRVGNTVSRLSGNLFTSPSSQPVYFLH